jgi:transposase
MYVAITRKKYKDTYHEQILLRESYREGKLVKTRTLLNLTNQPRDQVEAIAAVLKNKKDLTALSPIQSTGKTIGFSFVLLFLMNSLGILSGIGKSFHAKIALMLIVARVVITGSRLQALKWAKEEDKILDLLLFSKDEKEKLTDKTIYLGLDYMEENQEKIENKLFKSYYGSNPPKRVFYDVTSSYVEGEYENSELVAYGYNRDGKKGKKQVVIGLLTDEFGHAISIHTYPGNTNDVKTFSDQLNKLKTRFNLENIVIVGDGGMIKSDDIIKIKEMGYDYITSIGKPSIKKLIDDKDSQMQISLFDEDLKEFIDGDKRYILRQNPIRKEEITKTREQKLQRLQHIINEKTNYYNAHYKAKSVTMQDKLNKAINDLKLSSFVSVAISYKDGKVKCYDSKTHKEIIKTKPLATVTIVIDEKAKKEIMQLDGCYVIITSLIDETKDSKEDIHKAYKTLIKVENAFKTLKTDFLEIRPLYIKSDKRLKGHIALSMLSYNTALELKKYVKLAKLDFKSTIRELSIVQTVVNTINKSISYETIPNVSQNLKNLFNIIGVNLPNKL